MPPPPFGMPGPGVLPPREHPQEDARKFAHSSLLNTRQHLVDAVCPSLPFLLVVLEDPPRPCPVACPSLLPGECLLVDLHLIFNFLLLAFLHQLACLLVGFRVALHRFQWEALADLVDLLVE